MPVGEVTEFSVFGLVHDTRPAATEFIQDAVVGDRPADQGLGTHHRSGY
jgi:hypothetical protein